MRWVQSAWPLTTGATIRYAGIVPGIVSCRNSAGVLARPSLGATQRRVLAEEHAERLCLLTALEGR
jgi:hypothetical protein